MTGKQLKAWAAGIHDEAVIEMREANYRIWQASFSLRATVCSELNAENPFELSTPVEPPPVVAGNSAA